MLTGFEISSAVPRRQSPFRFDQKLDAFDRDAEGRNSLFCLGCSLTSSFAFLCVKWLASFSVHDGDAVVDRVNFRSPRPFTLRWTLHSHLCSLPNDDYSFLQQCTLVCSHSVLWYCESWACCTRKQVSQNAV